MKVLILRLLVLGMRVLYFPMKWRKTQYKLVWLSRQSGECSADMKMLSDALYSTHPELKQVFRLRYLKDAKGGSLSYALGILGDMWHLANATVAVTDTYSIPVSCLHHKKSLHIVQIWHALAAVKQFGLQAAGKEQGRDLATAKAMHMHENYTTVIAPSRATAAFYKQAFGCDDKAIMIASLPRVDVLLNGENKHEEFVTLNPVAKDKKLLVYVPTFRDGDADYIERLYNAFEPLPDVHLIVLPHPLSHAAKDERYHINGTFSTYDCMKLADGIITDYSACSVEGSLLDKPLWFFVPDYQTYKQEQGLNVELTDFFSHACFQDENALVAATQQPYDFEALTRFKNTFIQYQETDNTAKLADILALFAEH